MPQVRAETDIATRHTHASHISASSSLPLHYQLLHGHTHRDTGMEEHTPRRDITSQQRRDNVTLPHIMPHTHIGKSEVFAARYFRSAAIAAADVRQLNALSSPTVELMDNEAEYAAPLIRLLRHVHYAY